MTRARKPRPRKVEITKLRKDLDDVLRRIRLAERRANAIQWSIDRLSEEYGPEVS